MKILKKSKIYKNKYTNNNKKILVYKYIYNIIKNI